ncbi:MAG: type II 3-dehydroquinate dehydratase [Clostridia bacterium]|nr:type II 3-dehydroquinate dehydratase [Clostridia bacterium]
MKLLVINGPSLNMLGIREPAIYGEETYEDLCNKINAHCKEKNIKVEIYQSNHEGDLIDKIQDAFHKVDGIVINAAGYTHTSIAIADALLAVSIPAVEVHISEPKNREPYRHFSYTEEVCIASIRGEGTAGYIKAIDLLETTIKNMK